MTDGRESDGVPGEPDHRAERPRGTVDDDLAWLQRTHHNREHSHTRPGLTRSGRRRRRRHHGHRAHWYRPRNTVLIPLLVVVVVVVGFLAYVDHELGAIRRAPMESAYAGPASTGTNMLLIASDAPTRAVRADVRTMVVQLVHIDAGGDRAAMIDLPRDLLLPGTADQGRATIADRYRHGGTAALAGDIQALLGITITHIVLAAYPGYVRATDRLGGVDMATDKGIQHLDGAEALSYVDHRGINSVQSGRRNQYWMRGIVEAALTPRVLLNPLALTGLLRDLKPNLVLDDSLTTSAIRSLAWHSRTLSPTATRYLSVPYERYAHLRRQVVLLPNLAEIRQLGAAVARDNDSGIAVFDN